MALTTQLASLEPAPPEMERLIGAQAGNEEAMNGFTRMMAGSISPADFFAEENVGRILAAAGTGQTNAASPQTIAASMKP
jgi:hypothetical protein